MSAAAKRCGRRQGESHPTPRQNCLTTRTVHRQNCSVLLSFHTGNQIGARRDAPTRNVPVLVLCKAARATCKQMHAKSGPNCFLRDASREIRDPPLTKCRSSCHVLISTPRIMGSVVEHAYERTLLSTNHGIREAPITSRRCPALQENATVPENIKSARPLHSPWYRSSKAANQSC